MISVIALDPGYGNTKICLNDPANQGMKTVLLQSAVARVRNFGMAGIGMKLAQQAIQVRFDEHDLIVGPGAWNWNAPENNMDFSALASPGRRALFYAALAQALPPASYQIGQMVVGLPVPLLQDEIQAAAVINALRAYKGDHRFEIGAGEYCLNIQRLKVLPQPVGAYADWLVNQDLQVRKDHSQAEIGVLDLGQNTLDLYALQGGKVTPRFVGGGKLGVRRLLDLMDGSLAGRDAVEVDAELRSGKRKPAQAHLQSWLGEIMGAVERVWPNLRRFTAIIPVGGGSLLLGDHLRGALAMHGAAIHWPIDPVLTNAIGLWKYASALQHKEGGSDGNA
jgi:hypothetical protein